MHAPIALLKVVYGITSGCLSACMPYRYRWNYCVMRVQDTYRTDARPVPFVICEAPTPLRTQGRSRLSCGCQMAATFATGWDYQNKRPPRDDGAGELDDANAADPFDLHSFLLLCMTDAFILNVAMPQSLFALPLPQARKWRGGGVLVLKISVHQSNVAPRHGQRRMP